MGGSGGSPQLPGLYGCCMLPLARRGARRALTTAAPVAAGAGECVMPSFSATGAFFLPNVQHAATVRAGVGFPGELCL